MLLAPTVVAQQEDEVVLPQQPSKGTQRKRDRDAQRKRDRELREVEQRRLIDEENGRVRRFIDTACQEEPRRRDGQLIDDSTYCDNKALRVREDIDMKTAKAQSKAEALAPAVAEATDVYTSLFK